MKLSRLRVIAESSGGLLTLTRDGSADSERAELRELLADIDAEIAKAEAKWAALKRVNDDLLKAARKDDQRLAALEASEVELREHCQGNVPMSVFNDLKERVESMFEDLSSLENQVARELLALPERVKALESKPKLSLCDDVMHAQSAEDDAFKAWRSEPWPYGVAGSGTGMMCESAFREGFRAGRK